MTSNLSQATCAFSLLTAPSHLSPLLLTAGADDTPRGFGTRFFFWVFFLTMVIAHAAYSATLISFLAVETLVLPFQGLEGLLSDGTYRLGVVNGTAMYDYFRVK